MTTTGEKEFSIDDISDDQLHDLFSGASITTLLGSAISTWEPASLISGEEFGKSLYDLIFKDEVGHYLEPSINEYILWPLYQKLPFEVINDRCPNKSAINELLHETYNKDCSNPIHDLFANLLKERVITSIVTPNYDLCIDGAISRAIHTPIGPCMGSIHRVITRSDLPLSISNDSQIYFKVHGSADPKSNISLVYSLQQEGLLEDWKRGLFHRLINDRILLILGYSGKDFDLCQEFQVGRPKKIIWNFLNKESITANARRLKGKVDLTIILGDMRKLLSRQFRPIDARKAESKTDIAPGLRFKFTNEELSAWQVKILTTLNYNLPAIKLTARLLQEKGIDANMHIDLLGEQASALGSNGQYRKAASNHLEAGRIARTTRNAIEYFHQLNAASDAFRGYGNIVLPNFLHLCNLVYRNFNKDTFARSNQLNDVDNLLARNEILLLQEVYQLAKRFNLTQISWRVRRLVETRIFRVAHLIHASGNIFIYQQLKMWAIRFDIPEDAFIKFDQVTTPSPEEGYEQLFFPMGLMMEFRYRMNKEKDPLDKCVLDRTREFLRMARDLGIRPEIWKLLTLIRKRFPSQFTKADSWELNMEFKNCEYTLIRRIDKRFFGY